MSGLAISEASMCRHMFVPDIVYDICPAAYSFKCERCGHIAMDWELGIEVSE